MNARLAAPLATNTQGLSSDGVVLLDASLTDTARKHAAPSAVTVAVSDVPSLDTPLKVPIQTAVTPKVSDAYVHPFRSGDYTDIDGW